MQFIKHLLRIIFSAILGFWINSFIDLGAFFNVLLFMFVYIVVSLILEEIFKLFKKDKNGKP